MCFFLLFCQELKLYWFPILHFISNVLQKAKKYKKKYYGLFYFSIHGILINKHCAQFLFIKLILQEEE